MKTLALELAIFLLCGKIMNLSRKGWRYINEFLIKKTSSLIKYLLWSVTYGKHNVHKYIFQ